MAPTEIKSYRKGLNSKYEFQNKMLNDSKKHKIIHRSLGTKGLHIRELFHSLLKDLKECYPKLAEKYRTKELEVLQNVNKYEGILFSPDDCVIDLEGDGKIVVKIKDNGSVEEYIETPSKLIKYRDSMLLGNEDENTGVGEDGSVVIYRGAKIPIIGTNMVMDPLFPLNGGQSEIVAEGPGYAEIVFEGQECAEIVNEGEEYLRYGYVLESRVYSETVTDYAGMLTEERVYAGNVSELVEENPNNVTEGYYYAMTDVNGHDESGGK